MRKDFKPIGGMADEDPDDAVITKFVEREGIPSLVTPTAKRTAKTGRFTAVFPAYVLEALRLNAAQGQGSAAYQVLKALNDSGAVAVDAADLVPDRRSRGQ